VCPTGRYYQLGYTWAGVGSPAFAEIKDGAKITVDQRLVASRPKFLRRSLGPHVLGFCMPAPDRRDIDNKVWGARGRFLTKIPDLNTNVLRRFREFVRVWIYQNLEPLPAGLDTSLEAWLAKTHYPGWRKEQIRRVYNNRGGGEPDARDRRLDGFIKQEAYGEYKRPRIINSRGLYYKAWCGPWFKLIEEEVFNRPEFIKHIPVATWPSYLKDYLYTPRATYCETDYTSFECSFRAEVMKACECQMYSYMLQNYPQAQRVLPEIVIGKNLTNLKGVRTSVQGVRMSGDQCTSLGNGFTNLMLAKFWAHENGIEIKAVVEGDDGLIAVEGDIPPLDIFAELGFMIKFNVVTDFSHAGFCGIRADVEDLQNTADPVRKIVDFAWTSQRIHCGEKKAIGLLRAKAYSLVAEFPACPMITTFALRMLHLTAGVKSIYVPDYWSRRVRARLLSRQMLEMVAPPTPRTRALFSQLYGWTPPEQEAFERRCAHFTLAPITDPVLLSKCAYTLHPDVAHNYAANVLFCPPGSSWQPK